MTSRAVSGCPGWLSLDIFSEGVSFERICDQWISGFSCFGFAAVLVPALMKILQIQKLRHLLWFCYIHASITVRRIFAKVGQDLFTA